MKNPLVSVIVPTYNGEKFITQTLESIINQDYENLEIIVVDDVSKDNTVEVAKKILENSGRNFQLVKRTVNGRQSAARNTGLKASNGEYVIFFDHDDLAEKNFVSSLLREAENKNADLVFCGIRLFYKNENRYKDDYDPSAFNKILGIPENYLLTSLKKNLEFCTVWNFIFKKDFIKKNHLKFPEDCFIFEDTEFILKAIALSSRMSHVNGMLYNYVMHETQQTRSDKARSYYKNAVQEAMTLWRAGRCILKHTNDKFIKNYVLVYFFADKLLKQCTRAAQAGDHEYYNLNVKHFQHKKIREIMLSTLKFIFKEPALCFKSLMILYFPNFYYKLRRKRK